MNWAELIAQAQAARAAKIDAMEALHQKAADEGRIFDDEEQAQFDELAADVDSLDKQIGGYQKMETLSAGKAKQIIVPGTPSTQDPTGRSPIQVKSNLPKGIAFARYAMALAAGKGNLSSSLEIARKHWEKTTPEVVTVLKAAVAAGTTTDPTWAGPLVEYQTMSDEFIELLRPATIIGRLNGFRRVPFNVRIPRQTAGASVGWVGEGKPKPVSKLGFDAITLPFAKVAGIVAITEELARFSSPSAEALVRDDLVETIGTFLDVQFIDPAVAANAAANSPASITNGAHTIPSTGNTVDKVIADLTAMQQWIVGQGLSLSGLAWVMNPRTKISLANMRTTQDVYAFPSVAANNTLLGFPIVDSASVPLTDPGDGTPATTFIALMAPSEILLADDGSVTLDASREASIAMSDDGTGTLVSLWQQNLVGIRAERYIYWMLRRAAAVVVLTGVTY